MAKLTHREVYYVRVMIWRKENKEGNPKWTYMEEHGHI